jgi:REP element-mobilizing transposase RayT
LGEILDGTMRLNAMGLAIQTYWQRLSLPFAIELDAFIVMSNHIHVKVTFLLTVLSD